MKKHQKTRLVCLSLVATVLIPCRVVIEAPVLIGIVTGVIVTVATTPEAEAIRRRRYHYNRAPRSYTKRSATDRPSGMEDLQKWQKEAEERNRKAAAQVAQDRKKLEPLGILYTLPSGAERMKHNEFTYFHAPGSKNYYYCYYYDGSPVFIQADTDSEGNPAGRPPFPKVLLNS